MVMNAQERLYGMMAVVEEQQKVLSTSLAEFKKVTEELRTQKNELSKTVDSVSSEVSKAVSSSVIQDIGASQKAFNNEMMASCSQSLKVAKDIAKDLNQAKESSKDIYNVINKTLTKEVGKTVTIFTAVFLIISICFIGGFAWYYATKAMEQKEVYEYWVQKSDAAYSKCMKIKSCAKELK